MMELIVVFFLIGLSMATGQHEPVPPAVFHHHTSKPDDDARAPAPPPSSCKDISCPSGTVCKMVAFLCGNDPCPRVPECIRKESASFSPGSPVAPKKQVGFLDSRPRASSPQPPEFPKPTTAPLSTVRTRAQLVTRPHTSQQSRTEPLDQRHITHGPVRQAFSTTPVPVEKVAPATTMRRQTMQRKLQGGASITVDITRTSNITTSHSANTRITLNANNHPGSARHLVGGQALSQTGTQHGGIVRHLKENQMTLNRSRDGGSLQHQQQKTSVGESQPRQQVKNPASNAGQSHPTLRSQHHSTSSSKNRAEKRDPRMKPHEALLISSQNDALSLKKHMEKSPQAPPQPLKPTMKTQSDPNKLPTAAPPPASVPRKLAEIPKASANTSCAGKKCPVGSVCLTVGKTKQCVFKGRRMSHSTKENACAMKKCPSGTMCRVVNIGLRPQAKCVRQLPQQMRCPQNEIWSNCPSMCEASCKEKTPVCNKACGTPRCQCKPDFVRDNKGYCVKASQC